MFYMAVRYDGKDAQTTDLELSNSASSSVCQCSLALSHSALV